MPRASTRRNRQGKRNNLLETIAADKICLDLLQIPRMQSDFVQRVRSLLPDLDQMLPASSQEAFSTLIGWCQDPKAPPELRAASQLHQKVTASYHAAKRDLLMELDLNWQAADRDNLLASIPVIDVQPLAYPHPPKDAWACDHLPIRKRWRSYLQTKRLVDTRSGKTSKHFPIIMVDESKITHSIAQDESAIFKENGEIVGMVLRNFCLSQEVCEWADKIIKKEIGIRRNIRVRCSFLPVRLGADIILTKREDTGHMAQAGYSAGSQSNLSALAFAWVANILSQKLRKETEKVEAHNIAISSMFAIFWQLLIHRVPTEITDHFSKFMSREEIVRMDAGGVMTEKAPGNNVNWFTPKARGFYDVEYKGSKYTFNDAELAPPCGVMSENYSRVGHIEKGQPHKYAVAWTITRNQGDLGGNHFYHSRYGVWFKTAPNTLPICIPSQPHATSLANHDPRAYKPKAHDLEFCQRGLAFVTSSRLIAVWRKYWAEKIKLTSAVEELLEEEDEE